MSVVTNVVNRRVALKSLAFIPAVESLLRKGVTKSKPDAFVPDLEDSIAPKDKVFLFFFLTHRYNLIMFGLG